jgi:hypothetical protein
MRRNWRTPVIASSATMPIESQKPVGLMKAPGRRRSLPLAVDRPAEPLDHPRHRIEGLEKLPFRGHNRAGEAQRTDVEAELHQKRHHIAEFAVLHVEAGQP